jgi:hypothetical protein
VLPLALDQGGARVADLDAPQELAKGVDGFDLPSVDRVDDVALLRTAVHAGAVEVLS